jgi:3-dehydroquinate synthase
MAAGGLDRGSAVVALGGGVVGDLAGFCASAYMRGIALVQAPTTLLAQVDSAIGGKTAVDLTGGKNLAGAFWPPRLVLADTGTLATLPERGRTNGLVEAAKGALLAGPDDLEAFEDDVAALAAGDTAALERIVVRAAAFKAGVVSADERETGPRESLNLGHTLGHAIELVVGYGAVSHGLAVAEGMRFAAELAGRLAGAPPESAARTGALLERIGASRAAFLAASGAAGLDAGSLLEAMKADKKSRQGAVRFVLLREPGEWSVAPVDDEVLLGALDRWLAALGEGRA